MLYYTVDIFYVWNFVIDEFWNYYKLLYVFFDMITCDDNNNQEERPIVLRRIGNVEKEKQRVHGT